MNVNKIRGCLVVAAEATLSCNLNVFKEVAFLLLELRKKIRFNEDCELSGKYGKRVEYEYIVCLEKKTQT